MGTRQWEQNVLSQMHTVGGVLDHWNVELGKIDRNLRLMQASENADAPGVIAGFYHLVRLRDSAENTFMMVQPLRGLNDEFIEPTNAMLEGLRQADLQNDAVLCDRRQAKARIDAAGERLREQAHTDRLAHAIELFKAKTRTQTLMSPDVPYAQNAAGMKRPTRGQRKA